MSIKMIISSLALAVLSVSPVYAAVYAIDNDSSEVTFLVQHEVGFNTGFLREASGTFEIDADSVKSIKLDVKSTSVDTLNSKRDEAVKSGKFFDAENFPVILINSTEVSDKTVKADLIYKAKSYPILLDYTYLGKTSGGKEAVIKLSGKVKREDIGMADEAQTENETVGKEVELFIMLRGKAKE